MITSTFLPLKPTLFPCKTSSSSYPNVPGQPSTFKLYPLLQKLATHSQFASRNSQSSSMATTKQLIFLAFLPFLQVQEINSITFTIKNNCHFTIWPATLNGGGIPALANTGFELAAGASAALSAPPNWSGRMWARTHCSNNSSNAKFTCLSGDCGTGHISCSGASGSPPASLAEFTLHGADGKDFYDTSLVDGFNLPVAIEPDAGGCNATICTADVNRQCPVALQQKSRDGQVIGCKSPCLAFKEDQYCCSGSYNDPNICKPTNYSMVFKHACPQSYSYPYDDATSTFTCVGANYLITFCPANAMSGGFL